MTSTHNTWPVAIIGSGDVGTDLMIKILNGDGPLTAAAMVGTGPDSDGLARAARMGVLTTARGVDGLLAMPHFGDIRIVFDTTAAALHRANWAKLADTGVRMLDLTPAAIGPFWVPAVNPDDHLDAPNLNMITGDDARTLLEEPDAAAWSVVRKTCWSTLRSISPPPGVNPPDSSRRVVGRRSCRDRRAYRRQLAR
jgi:acetaldehyde dehydrogenase